MNYHLFKEKLLSCFVLESPDFIQEEDIQDYYIDYKAQTNYDTVEEWAKEFFIDFTIEDQGYQLI